VVLEVGTTKVYGGGTEMHFRFQGRPVPASRIEAHLVGYTRRVVEGESAHRVAFFAKEADMAAYSAERIHPQLHPQVV
jgi:hypothetical protein